MEKFTITEVLSEKEVNGKFGLSKKSTIKIKEFPETHGIFAGGLKVGQVLEGERVSRLWEGKTFWDIKLPKKSAGGVDAGKIEELLNGQLTIKLYLRKIMRALKIDDEFSDVEKAREVYNSTQKPVSDGYTSKGYDGEVEISTNDMPW